MQKSADAFRTISEVADDLSLPQHVLRFWETRFSQIRPLKRAGGRRYYRPADVSLLKTIRQLLYDDGYTIKGVQRLLKEQGAKGLSGGMPPAEVDWDEAGDADVDADVDAIGGEPADEPSPEGAAATSLPDPHRHDRAARSQRGRDAVEGALDTIEDCKRILDAVLAASR